MFRKIVQRVYPSRVFLSMMFGIIFGTIFSIVFRINFFSSVYWVFLAVLLFIFAIFRPNYLFVVLLFLVGSILGGFRVSGELVSEEAFSKLVGETVEVSGRIKGDPDFEGSLGKIKLENPTIFISRDESEEEVKMRGVIYFSGYVDSSVQRGDILRIRGKVSEGFGAYAASFYRPEVVSISKPESESVLLSLRDRFARSVSEGFGEENSTEASLGLAYLLGMRNGLEKETLEILSLVGLTHIVVASGTHLGILVGFFKKYFGKISRFSGLFFSLVFIFIFGSLVGWTASITRAAIVSSISLLGWYAGRKFEAWRVIVISMAATLLLNPMNLVDLGWLLSFGSFTGIMILAPEMKRFFYGKKKPNAVAEIILATVAATLMCAPILLYYFGSLSLISVVANLLILPTIPVAMGLVFLSGVVGFLPGFFQFDALKFIVVKITTIVLKYHLFVMKFFSERTEFLIQIPSGKTEVFLLYIVILAPFIFGSFVRAQKNRKLRAKFEKNYAERIRFTVE